MFTRGVYFAGACILAAAAFAQDQAGQPRAEGLIINDAQTVSEIADEAEPTVERVSEEEARETVREAVEDAAEELEEAESGETDSSVDDVVEEVGEEMLRQAPAPETLPTPDHNVELKWDELFAEQERSIAEEISIDLIDLDTLREALEKGVGTESLRLGLAECLTIALQQNQDILVSSYDPVIAESDVFSARGEFDPAWQTNAQYLRASTTLSQQQIVFGGISSVEQYQTTVDSTIAGKLHTGTQYSFTFNGNKEESTFGNFIEEFQTQGVFTLTQPLLRGFGLGVNRVRIHAARNNVEAANEQLRLTVLNTVAETIKAYWDLVGAVEGVKVREESLANAERLLLIAETRREIGTAADIEVLQAKAGVATRQSDLIAARSSVADASARLKSLMGLQEGGRFSKAQIVPVDRPDLDTLEIYDVSTIEGNYDESVRLALEKRPEIRIAQLQITNAELDEKRTRNEMLPQFDLTGSYGQGGRAHYLSHSLSGIRDGDDVFYTYGFQATVPLRNRAARGQHTRSRLVTDQAEQRLAQAEQNIQLNVDIALRQVVTNSILVESNRQAVRLQEANVIAEENRLRLGVSTPWQVLQVQEDLTLAQTQSLQAQIAYERALIDLQLAEGTILERMDIDFVPPEPAEKTGYFKSITPRFEWK